METVPFRQETPAKALIVGPNKAQLSALASMLFEIGFERVLLRGTMRKAWDAILSNRVDLVVTAGSRLGPDEYRFYQRLRTLPDHIHTPIVCLSSLPVGEEVLAFESVPALVSVRKPVSGLALKDAVDKVRKEADWQKKRWSDLEVALSSLAEDRPEAIKHCTSLLSQAPNPVPPLLMTTRSLVATGRPMAAEHILRHFLKRINSRTILYVELSTLLLAAGRTLEASHVLLELRRHLPGRLREACLPEEHPEDYASPQRTRAVLTAAFMDGLTTESQETVSPPIIRLPLDTAPQDTLRMTLARLFNTMGIALVNAGRYLEAIEYYVSALPLLARRDDAARVLFNIGLGWLRHGNLVESRAWFELSTQFGAERFKKAKTYLTYTV